MTHSGGLTTRPVPFGAIDYATTEMRAVIGDSPMGQLVPIPLIAEVAAGAFLGLEILAQNGREIDLEELARTLAAAVQLFSVLNLPT